MEEDKEYSVGKLLPFRHLTKEQQDLFIKLISDDSSSLYQVLFNVIDDTQKTIELIDILSGEKLVFPNRKKIYKLLEKIQIYTYIKHRDNTEKSYQLLAKIYNKRVSQIKAAVNRIDYLLANGKYKDIEKYENDYKEGDTDE